MAEEVLGSGDARSGLDLEALPRPLPVQPISEKRSLTHMTRFRLMGHSLLNSLAIHGGWAGRTCFPTLVSLEIRMQAIPLEVFYSELG